MLRANVVWALIFATGCSLNNAIYTSAAADNLSTFAAIRTSTPTDQIVEGNPIRRPLIGLGPAGAVIVTAALDFVVIRGCNWLDRRGYKLLARGIKFGIVGGHLIGIGNNTWIVLSRNRGSS